MTVTTLLCTLALAQSTAPTAPVRVIDIPGAPYSLSHVSLDSIEDLNGDGRRELIVGVPDLDTVFVFDPATGGLVFSFAAAAQNATVCPPAGATNVLFGWDVAATGDVDCDGVEDILVGAPLDFNQPACPAARTGRVYILSGLGQRMIGPTLQPWPAGAFTSSDGADWYGYAVSRAGADHDENGIEDIFIGQPFANGGAGRVEIVALQVQFVPGFGCMGLFWPPPPKVSVLEGTYDALAGGSLFGSGRAVLDLDGDGAPEIAVGAPNAVATGGGQATGTVRVYAGASLAAGPPALLVELSGAAAGFGGTAFGHALGAVGDRDGDGVPELVVGAPDPFEHLASFVTVHAGADLLLGNPAAAFTLLETPGPACGGMEFGHAVSGVGDLDQDPLMTPDVLVGVPNTSGTACRRLMRGAALGGVDASGAGLVWKRVIVPDASDRMGWDVTELEPGTFAVADPGGINPAGGTVMPRIFIF
jgi:hypothetical protein